MATAKDQPAEKSQTVNIVGSDGTTVEMVVVDGVRYRADDPIVVKLRKQAADKSRSPSGTK